MLAYVRYDKAKFQCDLTNQYFRAAVTPGRTLGAHGNAAGMAVCSESADVVYNGAPGSSIFASGQLHEAVPPRRADTGELAHHRCVKMATLFWADVTDK